MSHKTATLRNFLWMTFVGFALLGAAAHPAIIEAKFADLLKEQFLASSPDAFKQRQRLHSDRPDPATLSAATAAFNSSSDSRIRYPRGSTAANSSFLGFLGTASMPGVVARPVRIIGTSFSPGQTGSVTVEMDSQ